MKKQEKPKLILNQETLKNLSDPRPIRNVSINTCHTVACTVCHTC
jgi:hypothetical protein